MKNTKKEFLVSSEDKHILEEYRWYLNPGGYFIANTKMVNSKREKIFLHRIIMNCKKHDGLFIDHINGNKQDNRRQNLRIVSVSQNQMNKRKQSNNTSGFTGVYKHTYTGKWIARICLDKKMMHIGVYETKEAASKAYSQRATVLFGEFKFMADRQIERMEDQQALRELSILIHK